MLLFCFLVFAALHCFRSPLSESSESSERVAEKEAVYQVSARNNVKQLKYNSCPCTILLSMENDDK